MAMAYLVKYGCWQCPCNSSIETVDLLHKKFPNQVISEQSDWEQSATLLGLM